MRRALMLAEYGRGNVSPNPMVGCVIVHQDVLIGEGWHRQYGGPHAEVWAVEDAKQRGNADMLGESTVYVTLEPCSHTGKTPPCADLLVRHAVKRVVICNVDPNPLVSGRGIAKLKDAGIEVESGILKENGLELNKRFFLNISSGRPYVILKWAETANSFLSGKDGEQISISGALSNMRVHQWRSEEDAILVGFNTARTDNPRLNVRNWKGRNPVRIVIDRHSRLADDIHFFDKSQPTIVVNYDKQTSVPKYPERYANENQIAYIRIESAGNQIADLLSQLSKRGIQSVFVEGGATVLRAFLETGLWDEVRRCQSMVAVPEGVQAPEFKGRLTHSEKVEDDLWTFYKK